MKDKSLHKKAVFSKKWYRCFVDAVAKKRNCKLCTMRSICKNCLK